MVSNPAWRLSSPSESRYRLTSGPAVDASAALTIRSAVCVRSSVGAKSLIRSSDAYAAERRGLLAKATVRMKLSS